MRAGNRFLRIFTPINKGSRNVGSDNEQIGIEIFGEQGRAQVFINNGFYPVQIMLFIIICRNTAATGAYHNTAALQ